VAIRHAPIRVACGSVVSRVVVRGAVGGVRARRMASGCAHGLPRRESAVEACGDTACADTCGMWQRRITGSCAGRGGDVRVVEALLLSRVARPAGCAPCARTAGAEATQAPPQLPARVCDPHGHSSASASLRDERIVRYDTRCTGDSGGVPIAKHGSPELRDGGEPHLRPASRQHTTGSGKPAHGGQGIRHLMACQHTVFCIQRR
jgi:hypothetical protein